MASVQIRNVTKRYDDTEVIHGVSLDIEDGEFVVVVGPSGCGKSTLLRMVAGLERISSGEIAIDGERVNDRSLNIDAGSTNVYQVGRRRFARVSLV